MPGKEPKEPENITTFDEGEYKDNLLEQGYSEDSAKMLSEKKKDQLTAQAEKGPVAKIEIDLTKL
jgi:hypothetical protein